MILLKDIIVFHNWTSPTKGVVEVVKIVKQKKVVLAPSKSLYHQKSTSSHRLHRRWLASGDPFEDVHDLIFFLMLDDKYILARDRNPPE